MNVKDQFKKNGFAVVRNFIDIPDNLYEYSLENKFHGKVDPQVPTAPSFYNDIRMNELHIKSLKKVEELTGIELYKTYNYYRVYNKGDVLKLHKDRVACEISVTLSIGYKNKQWPIWIADYNNEPHCIVLEPGDGLLYHGCDLYHWRSKNIDSDDCSQLFLHYVDKNGPYYWARDDIMK